MKNTYGLPQGKIVVAVLTNGTRQRIPRPQSNRRDDIVMALLPYHIGFSQVRYFDKPRN